MGGPPGGAAARRAVLAAALARVAERVDRACASAGRRREEVSLVVVTKYFPVADVELLAALGVTDIGESRDQEAADKLARLPPPVRAGLGVHFVGQVQTRKAASVARYADAVHSVDRSKLVTALSRGAVAAGRSLDVLVQVSLDGDPGRGGMALSGVGALADQVAAADALRLRGVMAVAPLGADPARAFATLAEAASGIQAKHVEATWISAGMSADLEAAVANGATHLRVGTAILGPRPSRR